jgi:hypothetical protein
LRWLATAGARIAIAWDDDKLLAPVSGSNRAPENTNARKMRALAGPSHLQMGLKFRWDVAIRRHVAVDFEADADFNQNGRRPSHSDLPFIRENINRAERTRHRKYPLSLTASSSTR